MDEVDRTLLDRDDPRGRAFAAQALDEFCQLAEPDPELVAYIEAKADRATRAELMRITGLSLVRYRKVRRRLDRLSRRLSFQAAPRPRKRGK
jgi:hypothetical protein